MTEWTKVPVLKTGGCNSPVGSNPTLSAMSIQQYKIPMAALFVECEEGTNIDQAIRDLLYVGCEADDDETKFRVLKLNLGNIYKASTGTVVTPI